ncbi:helix-turn-helix domain-containing protein [Candidatus Omnitrophota bacterium]
MVMNLERTRNILASKVRTFRMSRNLTQEQLAEAVNIHTTYISRIESGKKLPTLHIICKIADVFGAETYELLLDEVKTDSFDHKRRKLIGILRETCSSGIDVYSDLLSTLHKRYRKSRRKT